MTKLWFYEVSPKTGELLQRRDVENQRRDVVETEHPDVMTFPNDISTFEVGFGGFLAHFELIIEGFKAETQGIEGRMIWDEFWVFFRENKLPLCGNTLGFVLGEISRVRFWKRKNT